MLLAAFACLAASCCLADAERRRDAEAIDEHNLTLSDCGGDYMAAWRDEMASE